jgi:hypothetical protein
VRKLNRIRKLKNKKEGMRGGEEHTEDGLN